MKKKKKQRLVALLMVSVLSLCFNTAVFAAEAKNSIDVEINSTSSYDDTYPVAPINESIRSFQGEYSNILNIPFTVTDSSRPVRFLYAIRYANGSSVNVDLAVRNSTSSVWFWTQFNVSGSSQIKEIGRLQPGNYVLHISPDELSPYAISGEIYYYN